jgi:transcriptional regulator with XRE-family HTH domain
MMPNELGAWLRQQREARGWTRPEMARQLIRAGQARGDKHVPGLDSTCHNIYRWERGADGLSERYKLHYCQAFGIRPSQFGPPGDPAPRSAAVATEQLVPYVVPVPALRGLPPAGIVAYRGIEEPVSGESAVEREVLMAAHDGSEHAERADSPGIGDVSMEQLRADLVRLSHQSDIGEPFPVFLEMRRVRARIYRLLDLQLWPREQTDLYFLLGCLNGLMGLAADRLGYPDAAEELIRAGWAYGNAIDHRPLMATLRQQQAHVTYWRGNTRESRDLAASGLVYLSAGPTAADLYLKFAQAEAKLGDTDTARRAITDAHRAREREHHDDLLDFGGEFLISLATHHYFAGAALAEIQGAEREAAEEVERASSLYAEGPRPGEQHWFGAKALASIDLAAIRLRTGGLDAAVMALEPVLSLPVSQRITAVTTRLSVVRDELHRPIFSRSPQAQALDEQIEEFSRETITVGLHSLPG